MCGQFGAGIKCVFYSIIFRDSSPFSEFYNIPEAQTVVRGTLRYQGFPEFVKAFVKLGWLNPEKKDWLSENLTWAQVMQKAIGASDASER